MSMLRAINIIAACLIMACCAKGTSTPAEDRNDRLRQHLSGYWEGVNVSGLQADSLEQKLVDFLFLTTHADSLTRRNCWRDLAAKFTRSYPDRTVVDYLGDKESPIYAPAMLDEYLETLADVLPKDNIQRQRVVYLLESLRKNRPGDEIADIELTLPGGTHSSLRKLIATQAEKWESNSEEITIFFYDPDCDECSRVIAEMNNSETGADNVIAVSITDETKTLPESWISTCASDPDDIEEKFYLPVMPQIYKVSGRGIVIER